LRVSLGVHVSIAGGLAKAFDRARALGCTTMQIFSRNPRAWKVEPLAETVIAAFRAEAQKGDIDPIIIHTPYLLNLAAEDEELHRRSIAALAQDLERAEQLRATHVVTHLGSTKRASRRWGISRVVEAIRKVLAKDFPVLLVMENSAGGGHSIGSQWEELGEIIHRVGGDERVKVCFDSCHGFAAGYDFRSPEKVRRLTEGIERTIGWTRMGLLHLNDCGSSCGGHRDRHQHIGEGTIGREGFRNLLRHPRFRRLPMILETPKKHPRDDQRNLARIRRLLLH
jgi:deoxyribonuclease-4